jgi:hypothetical protein
MIANIIPDRAGRVLISKRVRLQPNPDTAKTPVPLVRLKKERGVWVYQGARTRASIPTLIRRNREKRLRELMGQQSSPARC